MRIKVVAYLILSLLSLQAHSTCMIDLSIVQIPQGSDVPQETVDYLSQRLQSVCGRFSFDTEAGNSRFFIAGRFNNSYKSTIPGPPEKTAVHSALTLYIGDLEAKKVFSTLSIELLYGFCLSFLLAPLIMKRQWR